MFEALDWTLANLDAIGAAFASLYAVVTIVVGLTPTPKDDDFLRRLSERLSFLAPRGVAPKIKLPGAAPKREPEPGEIADPATYEAAKASGRITEIEGEQ